MKHIFRAPLADGNSIYLQFTHKPTAKDIDKIKKWLEIFEENLIDNTPEVTEKDQLHEQAS